MTNSLSFQVAGASLSKYMVDWILASMHVCLLGSNSPSPQSVQSLSHVGNERVRQERDAFLERKEKENKD